MGTQRCQNHGPVRLLVPLLEFNQGPKQPGEHAEPSEPPLTNAANQPGRTAGLSAAGGLGQMRMNAKKKEKTRRETTAIKVWVTPAEKAAITVKADAYWVERLNLLPVSWRSDRLGLPTRPT